MSAQSLAIARLAWVIAASSPSPTEADVAEAPAGPPPVASALLPDLGTVRYHDPVVRRQLWLGLDVGGMGLPAGRNDLGRPVWTVGATPSWALAVHPRIAVGGRHGMSWYDARNIRLRMHTHELQLSGRPLGDRSRLRDRVAIGLEVHDLRKATVDGSEFRLGGLRDVVLQAGYGLEHDLGQRVRLGWRVDARQVWVWRDTQRQLRGALRVAVLPQAGHRVALSGVGFYVNRDADQAGVPVGRNAVYAQLDGEYTYMSTHGVGVVVGLRYATSFLRGRVPIVEVREESLQRHYGEAFAGLRVAWE